MSSNFALLEGAGEPDENKKAPRKGSKEKSDTRAGKREFDRHSGTGRG